MQIAMNNFRTMMQVILILGLALLAAPLASAQTQSKTQEDEQFQKLIRSVEGRDLFRAYCASCHGKDAKGNGPAASALKATVPDLTILSQKHDGKFPEARVRRIITGDHVLASHGSREMPVWGPIFHQVEEDVDRGYVRVENLVKYIQSIQVIQQK
jgi:mono/diheme cytochrome c family protein